MTSATFNHFGPGIKKNLQPQREHLDFDQRKSTIGFKMMCAYYYYYISTQGSIYFEY